MVCFLFPFYCREGVDKEGAFERAGAAGASEVCVFWGGRGVGGDDERGKR